MKKIFFLGVALVLSLLVFSQQKITAEQVKEHIGDSVTVCGKVFTTRYLESAKNTPTFLNIGAAYPDQLLTVVIWGELRNKFAGKPEELFKDQAVCITRRITLYREQPQLVLGRVEDLKRGE